MRNVGYHVLTSNSDQESRYIQTLLVRKNYRFTPKPTALADFNPFVYVVHEKCSWERCTSNELHGMALAELDSDNSNFYPERKGLSSREH